MLDDFSYAVRQQEMARAVTPKQKAAFIREVYADMRDNFSYVDGRILILRQDIASTERFLSLVHPLLASMLPTNLLPSYIQANILSAKEQCESIRI